MNRDTKFIFTISNVSAQVQPMDGNSNDTQIHFLIGGQTYKTDTIWDNLNPVFKFNKTFELELNEDDITDSLAFQIEVYERNRIMSDELMGTVGVDFHTMLTGPSSIDLAIFNAQMNTFVGRIRANISVQHVGKVVMKPSAVSFNLDQPDREDYWCSITLKSENKTVESGVISSTDRPKWDAVNDIVSGSYRGIRSFVEEEFVFKAYRKRLIGSALLGTASIKIENKLPKGEGSSTSHNGNLIADNGQKIGKCSFKLEWQSVPFFVQAKAGIRTEQGVMDYEAALKTAPKPKNIVKGRR
ncbi:hypothetical protein PCE1_003733 [Barthelona sp. PCE]